MPPMKPHNELALYALLAALAVGIAAITPLTAHLGSAALLIIACVALALALVTSVVRRARSFERESSARALAEEQLRRMAMAVEQSPACVLITDRDGVVQYANLPYCRMVGQSAEQLVGNNMATAREESLAAILPEIRSTVETGATWRGELRLPRSNAKPFQSLSTISPIFDADGSTSHILIVHEDITERLTYREHLFQHANFDALTGLPNRALAMDRLAQAINSAERHQRSLTLMCVDLDRFKVVNESLGLDQGDQLLIEAAQRLQDCVREEDTVARLGSDEFLVLLLNQRSGADATLVAEKIINSIAEPFFLAGRELNITASVGLSVFPTDASNAAELLRNGESALTTAKQAGRNHYHYYTPEMNRLALQRLNMETQLRHAVSRGELGLHYQPVIDLDNGQVVAVEALARWRNSELGHPGPDQFIPVAEESGLIIPIGEWLLTEACMQAQSWVTESRNLRVAVNVSSRQFVGGHIIGAVERALASSGLAPELLELELTERLLLNDLPQTQQVMTQLKRLGVRLVLDDFGTGFSSLSYLKRYPFDALKIDRSFVADLHEPEAAALIRAIIAMAHSLGLEVIGEGIEEVEQACFLRHHGCELAQGFFYSRPLPAEDFHLWYGRRREEQAQGQGQ